MKFGMLHLFESPVGRTEQEMLNEQIDLMQAAEDLGYDSVWPAEHHFSEYGLCSSIALALAAVARTTRRIRLGSGVVVLPFHHPIRVAEEFAMIDLISDGRVDFGVGRGYQPIEFQGFGIDQSKSKEIYDESLEIIRRAWTQETVDFQGKHFQLKDVAVRPKPLQRPHPPIWMAALSDGTFEQAGRLGYNLLCSPVFGGSLQVAKDNIKRYRDALVAAGHDPSTRQVGALVMVYAGETQERAREDFAQSVLWYFRTLGKYVAPKVGQPSVPSYEGYETMRDMASAVEWDELLGHGTVICGETDFVTERVEEIRDVVGIDHMLSWTRVGGLAEDKVLGHVQTIDRLPGVAG